MAHAPVGRQVGPVDVTVSDTVFAFKAYVAHLKRTCTVYRGPEYAAISRLAYMSVRMTGQKYIHVQIVHAIRRIHRSHGI